MSKILLRKQFFHFIINTSNRNHFWIMSRILNFIYIVTRSCNHYKQTAGVIAARINGIGMEGIASKAEVYSVKILDSENKATISAVIKSIEWCIQNNIDIINRTSRHTFNIPRHYFILLFLIFYVFTRLELLWVFSIFLAVLFQRRNLNK